MRALDRRTRFRPFRSAYSKTICGTRKAADNADRTLDKLGEYKHFSSIRTLVNKIRFAAHGSEPITFVLYFRPFSPLRKH
jgi:hypothetical protein